MNAPLPPGAVAVTALPVAAIAASPTNPRKHFDATYLAELAESIKSHGVIQPITVRPNPDTHSVKLYEIVVGECRFRAAQLAGLEHIPAFWRELDDKQVLEIQVIENLQRRDVHELEEAAGYRMLMDRHGYSVDDIADKIGKSKGYVYARLKLTALCEAGKDAFFDGKLDASTALLIARIRGDKLQQKAVKDITTGGYNGEPKSVRDTKYYIENAFTISLKQATFKLDDAGLLPAAGSCTDCPLRSGNDPDIFADLDDVDVCTDVKCFEEKQLARRDQLIANAEKHKIPVLRGDDITHDIMRHQYGLYGLNNERYIALDAKCDDDEQGRTYREILGDKAPVSALIEFGTSANNKQIAEVAEPTAIAKALKKAGIETKQEEEDPEELAAREQEDKEREQRQQELSVEEARRATLLEKSKAVLNAGGQLFYEDVLRLLVIGFIEQWFEYFEPETTLMAEFGYQEPEEGDDPDYEALAEQALAAIKAWPLSTLTAFTAALIGNEDLHPGHDWQAEQKAAFLDPLAELLKVDTPTQAAQAQEVGATEPKGKTKTAKKTKAKAGTAATASPNEPAAPAKTELLHAQAWPFPTGARK
ncbi:MAG: ParB/RepB/Spo0J family partition protein [Rhodocyclales bacterium]|nr:ParB/RepB/Spo0J family partition protein [Rhodocyclales bacterium]